MKKFTISSDALKPVLRKLSQAVGKSTDLPALSNLYCKVEKSTVELITSDTELTISCVIDADTEGAPFELLLPFDFMSKVNALIKSAPIQIEHPSTRKAKILSGTDVYELNSLEKLENFPNLPAVPKKNTLQLDASFVSLLSKAMHTCSKDTLRPAMTRSCLDIQAAATILVSTDAHRLFRYVVKSEEGKITDQLMFSPKLAKAIEGLNSLEVSWSQKQVAVKSDNITIWSTRHEDKYPDYQRIISMTEPNLTVQRDGLVAALHKACISNVHDKSTTVHLKKEEGFIHFETKDPDYVRNILTKISGNYTGTTESVTINAQMLLSLMEQIEVEQVRLHIVSRSKALLITSEEDLNYLGLLMPIIN